MSDLIAGIQHDRKLMLTANKEAKERGVRLAEAEAAYQSAKYKRTLELKAEGMAATLIQLTLKGDPEVNGYLFARDCAQVEYDSAKEAINTYKLSARLQEAQLQREWNQAGGIL